MTLFQGYDHAPQSDKVVASGDYKSVDPANADIIIPEGGEALCVNLNITAATGGGGVTVTIYGYDVGSDTYQPLLVSALKVATGFTRLQVSPWIAASANVIAQTPIAKKVRVSCVGSGTRTTLNYSVGIDIT